MFVKSNPNPNGNRVGDCVIRAISIATGKNWEQVYIDLAIKGFVMGDMPSSNSVWGAYLRDEGYTRYTVPNTCPDCYTVRDFASENPIGTYILGTGTHAVAVKEGDYYDAFDSGDEHPIYYWERKE